MTPNGRYVKCSNEKCNEHVYVTEYRMRKYKLHYHSKECQNHGKVAWDNIKMKFVIDNASTMTQEEMARKFGCDVTCLYRMVSKWRKQGVQIPQILKKTPQAVYRQANVKIKPKTAEKPKRLFDEAYTHFPINLNKSVKVKPFNPDTHKMVKIDGRTWKQVAINC